MGSDNMKLEIGNFQVKDVVFGDKSIFRNGILSINKEEAMAFIKEDEHKNSTFIGHSRFFNT